jgi:hypothetical protein
MKAAKGNINLLTPPFVKNVYLRMISFMQTEFCNVHVYGNQRGVSYDYVILEVAELLGKG